MPFFSTLVSSFFLLPLSCPFHYVVHGGLDWSLVVVIVVLDVQVSRVQWWAAVWLECWWSWSEYN